MGEIVFYSKHGNGGYGDRLVGIAAINCMSKIFGVPFRIVWDEDLSLIFEDYEKYDPQSFKNHIRVNWVDSRASKVEEFFKDKSIDEIIETKFLIECNQPIHTFFWSKEGKKIFPFLTENLNFNEEYHSSFRDIYSKILKLSQNIIDSIFFNIDLGIQIRCGDCYSSGNSHCYISKEKFEVYVSNSKNTLPSIFGDSEESSIKRIFITSDCKDIYPIFKEKFVNCEVLFLDKESDTHFDMKGDTTDFHQLIKEHFILTKCKNISTMFNSNYGITAAMIAGLKEVTSHNFNGNHWESFTKYNLRDFPRCKTRLDNFFYVVEGLTYHR